MKQRQSLTIGQRIDGAWRAIRGLPDDRDAIIQSMWSGAYSPVLNRIDTPTQAYQLVGTVFAAVKRFSDACTVPLVLLDKAGQRVENAKLTEWVNAPGPGLSWAHFIGMVAPQVILTGASRWWIDTEAKRLMVFPYGCNQLEADPGVPPRYPPVGYKMGERSLTREQVIDCAAPDPFNPNDPTSPVEAASLGWRTAYLSSAHVQQSLEHGAQIPGVFIGSAHLNEDEYKQWQVRLTAMFSGARRSGTIPLLTGDDIRMEKMGWSIADLALPVLMGMSKEDILRTLGVPPALMADGESRYANYDAQLVTFHEYSLRPLWRIIAGAITLRVLPLLGITDGRVEFDESGCWVVQKLRELKLAGLNSGVANGVLLVNEARQELGLPDVDYGWQWWGANALSMPVESGLSRPAPKPARGIDSDRLRAAVAELVTSRALPAPARRDTTAINGRSAEVRTVLWRKFDNTSASLERRYAKSISKVLTDALKELEASAEASGGKSASYDREKTRKAMTGARMALLPAIWRTGGEDGQAEVPRKAARSFELLPGILDLLRQRAAYWTELTESALYESANATVARVVEEGGSLHAMIDALRSTVNGDAFRAERIARTEVIGTLNGGKLDGYGQMGIERKEWLATQDDRTRDEHAEADGQTVGIADSFDVGGQSLEYPGDPNGDPGNIVNCRCTVLPVVGATTEEE